MTPPTPPPPEQAAAPALPTPRLSQRGRARRVLLWTALMALLGVAQSLLVVLSLSYENSRAQDDAERVATLAAVAMKREVLRQARELQSLGFPQPDAQRDAGLAALLRARQGLERVEWRNDEFGLVRAQDTPYAPALFAQMPRAALSTEAELACSAARIAGRRASRVLTSCRCPMARAPRSWICACRSRPQPAAACSWAASRSAACWSRSVPSARSPATRSR